MAAPLQLHMRHELRDLAEPVLPKGYSLRCLTPDDAAAWGRLLSLNGQLGEWPTHRAARHFGPDRTMVLEASCFVMCDGEPVATASLWEHPEGPYAPTAELGWVGTHREHRGRGLGRVVCLSVMRQAAERGEPSLFLRTDDHRLPAIALYLSLGWQPWQYDDSAPERWRGVMDALKESPRYAR